MPPNTALLEKITDIAERDGRYNREAFFFVLAGLEFTVSKLSKRRHLTGQELARGLGRFAIEQYGYMARTVLETWGLHETGDFGEIVYLLIEDGLMGKTAEDKVEDFYHVYDFDDMFEWEGLKPPAPPELFE